MGILQSIRVMAKRDAASFVQEFGEALDTDATDWGREAFSEYEHGLRACSSLCDEEPADGVYWSPRINGLRVSYANLVARYTREMVAL